MTTVANLLALLSLDPMEYLEGLDDVRDSTDSFTDTLADVGGGIVLGGLTAAASAVAAIGIAAWDAGNTIDGAMDSITVATGAVGPELELLRKDFDVVFANVPTDADSAASAIGVLNSRLGIAGEELQNLAMPLLEMSRMTGGDVSTNAELFARVIGDWALPIDQASSSLDELYVASQSTGAPIDQLMARIVQFGAPMRQFGFTFEESAAMLAKWEAEGVNTELVMGSLRIAAGKFADEGVDLRKGLDDTIEAIRSAGSESEALSISMGIFGARAGGDMAAAIRENRFEVAGLIDMMHGADGAVMSNAEKTADWGETWQMFLNQIMLKLAPLGDELMADVGLVLDKVVAIFDDPASQETIDNFLGLIMDGITWVVEHAPEFIDGFNNLITFLQENEGIVIGIFAALGVAALVWGIVTAAAAWTAIAPFLPVIAVLLLIAAIVALVYVAWTENWWGIQETTAVVLENLKKWFDSAFAWISDMFWDWWTTVSELFAAFQALMEGDFYVFGEHLRNAWEAAWSALLRYLELWKDMLVGVLSPIWDAIVNWWSSLDWGSIGDGISDGIREGIERSLLGGIPSMIETIGVVGGAMMDAWKGFFGIHSPSVVMASEIGEPMGEGVSLGWTRSIGDMVADIPGTLGRIVPAAQPAIAQAAAAVGPVGNGAGTPVIIQLPGVLTADDPQMIAQRIEGAVEILLHRWGLK